MVVGLNIDGKIYRTAADFDRGLARSKRLVMQMDFFMFMLFFVYVWFRLTFRPGPYHH